MSRKTDRWEGRQEGREGKKEEEENKGRKRIERERKGKERGREKECVFLKQLNEFAPKNTKQVYTDLGSREWSPLCAYPSFFCAVPNTTMPLEGGRPTECATLIKKKSSSAWPERGMPMVLQGEGGGSNIASFPGSLVADKLAMRTHSPIFLRTFSAYSLWSSFSCTETTYNHLLNLGKTSLGTRVCSLRGKRRSSMSGSSM